MKFIDTKHKKMPALGFGTYQLAGTDAERAVTTALDAGYRHFDTAQIYNNEADVGHALSSSGVHRNDIFLTTKIWMDRLKDGDMQKSMDESLKKLKTDHVDLLLIHWPTTTVPFAEQFKALQSIQQDGRAKMIGVSNFTVAQMKEVVEDIKAPIVTNQVEYHPLLSQRPVLDYLLSQKMFLTAYSPLAQGRIKDHPLLNDIAKKYGKNAGQISLRWLIQQDSVAAIPKAASEKNIRANIDIFDFELTANDMQSIAALGKDSGRIVTPDWAPQWDKAA